MSAYVSHAFAKLGARVKIELLELPAGVSGRGSVELDIRQDLKGEYFLIRKTQTASVEILQSQPRNRHLLLLTRVPSDAVGQQKSRFLMGHDERHWFVAAIPESTPVSTVDAARQALKPSAVAGRETVLRAKRKHARSNKAWVRQGEWFFVPAPDMQVKPFLILKHEPVRRGGGKPHLCDELYREGGELVYVSRQNPNGLTEDEYRNLDERIRSSQIWRTMRRNPRVLVRGKVRHPDHATIVLDGWHELHMNTETRALAMQQVAFLD